MLRWGSGAVREPEVGSSQAEFNDGELGQTTHRPLPIPLAHGPDRPEGAQGKLRYLPKADSHGPFDFVQKTKC